MEARVIGAGHVGGKGILSSFGSISAVRNKRNRDVMRMAQSDERPASSFQHWIALDSGTEMYVETQCSICFC